MKKYGPVESNFPQQVLALAALAEAQKPQYIMFNEDWFKYGPVKLSVTEGKAYWLERIIANVDGWYVWFRDDSGETIELQVDENMYS